jgi:hypothetical protein
MEAAESFKVGDTVQIRCNDEGFAEMDRKIMAEQTDGGPAFPVVETHPVHGSRIDEEIIDASK